MNILSLRPKILVSPLRLCLAFLSCLSFAACGRGTSATDNGVVLTVWESYTNEEHRVFVELTKDFDAQAEKEFGRKVTLSINRVPFDGLLEKLKTAAISLTTPDVCRVNIGDMPTLAYGKTLVKLDELENFGYPDIDTLRRQFIDAAISSNIIAVKGKTNLYGLPDQTTCVALFWNKEMFRQRGKELLAAGLNPSSPPRTWDEFVSYAKVLTVLDRQLYGFAMDRFLWWTFPFFNTFGADALRMENGKWRYTLDEDSGVRALQFKVDLYGKHGVEAGAWLAGSVGPDQGFMNGKYAMILNGPWRLDSFRQAKIDYGVSLIPRGPAGTSTNVGGTDMVIFRKSRHPQIAYAFLRYITSKEYQIRWSRALDQIPVRLDAIEAVAGVSNPDLRIFMEQMRTARPRPPIPNYRILDEVVSQEMELALKGLKSPADALASAGREVDRKILAEINAAVP